jgi:hypothetical protein
MTDKPTVTLPEGEGSSKLRFADNISATGDHLRLSIRESISAFVDRRTIDAETE